MVRGLRKPGDPARAVRIVPPSRGARGGGVLRDRREAAVSKIGTSCSWRGRGRTGTCGWYAGRCPRSSTAVCAGSLTPRPLAKRCAGTIRDDDVPVGRRAGLRRGALDRRGLPGGARRRRLARYRDIMRGGSDSELSSALALADTRIIKDAAGVQRAGSVPVASAELFVVVDVPKRSTGTVANVPLCAAWNRQRSGSARRCARRGPHLPARHQRDHRRPDGDFAVHRTRARLRPALGRERVGGGRHLRGRRHLGRVRDLVRCARAAAGLPPRRLVPVGAGAPRVRRRLRPVPDRADHRPAAGQSWSSARTPTTEGQSDLVHALIATLRALGFSSFSVVSVLIESALLSPDRRRARLTGHEHVSALPVRQLVESLDVAGPPVGRRQ